MLPYYIKLPELKLSTECMNRITNSIMSDEMIMNEAVVGQEFFTRGTTLGARVWDNDPELIALEKRCTLPRVHKSLLHNRPGDNSLMHTDEFPGRITILYFPVYPEPSSYDPIVFWEKRSDGQVEQVAFAADDGVPFIFNGLALHGVPHINAHRINIQLSFNETIDEIASLIEQNKFFI